MPEASLLPALLADLARAFPRQKIERGTLAVYARELSDVPAEVLSAAVSNLIRSSEWFPTVRAIREQAAELTLNLPTEAEALEQIQNLTVWARDQQGDPPAVHPLVKSTVDLVGGYHAFRTEDGPVVRGQFLRLWRDARQRAILNVQVGRPELTAGETRRALPAG